jgi:hypothetical protein
VGATAPLAKIAVHAFMQGELLSARFACRVFFVVDPGVTSHFLPALFD